MSAVPLTTLHTTNPRTLPMTKSNDGGLLTFGGHLDVLRRMLFRILAVVVTLGIVVFCCKNAVFRLLLAPTDSSFMTFSWINQACRATGMGEGIASFHVKLISTELAGQFMAHLTTSCMLALLLASPYIVFELFGFVAPALYGRERKIALKVLIAVYLLFFAGLTVSYFVAFPLSFYFLGTYSISSEIESQINISSYVQSFTMLSLGMGLVFQIPVVVLLLTRLGIVNATLLRRCRRHAILVIVTVAAIITPSVDILTLTLVSLPLCLLYEAGVWIASKTGRKE